MNRRSILSLSAAAVFGLALAAESATAQTKTLKEQLLGTWTLVSFDSLDASGAKVPNMEGATSRGWLSLLTTAACPSSTLPTIQRSRPKTA